MRAQRKSQGIAVLDSSPSIAAPAPRERMYRLLSKRSLLITTCLLAGVVAATSYLWQSRHARTPLYVTTAVTRGTVAPTVVASGAVNPVTIIQVGTYVSGVIQDLRCDFNTQVRRGQLCAKIDPRPYQTVVDQDRANLAVAKAQLAKDQANLSFSALIHERDRGLLERGIISQETLDGAKNAYDQAVAQVALDQSTVKQHEAALDAALVNLGYTDIVSPVDGTVVSRNITQGQTVAASFQTPTLFLIATDLTKMQVDTNVSESDIGGINPGNRATFTVEAYPERTFSGEVIQVRQAPQTVQNVVTYDVVLSAANPDNALKPGMTAAARIITSQRDDVLRVPNQALRYAPSTARAKEGLEAEPHVWILRDNKPIAVPIKVGLQDDAYSEILSGIDVNEFVIVSEHTSPATPSASGAPVRGPRL